MKTADYTEDQNKTVYAVPGDITRPMSEGCLRLIKDGAMVYTEPNDLMYEFRIHESDARLRTYLDCSMVEKQIICAIGTGVNHDEDIIVKAGISPADLARGLTVLQLKNLIKSVGNGEWTLV